MSELKNKDEQYKELLKYNKMSDESKSRISFIIQAIFVTFFVVVTTVFIMHIITNYENISAIIGSFTNKNLFDVQISDKPDITPSKFNFKMLSRYQNILVLGVDSNGPNTMPFSGVRSDTIIVLNIDNHTKSINAISIPRDSKVYISDGHGIQKINAAYAIGGIELTKKTIEETLGIKIHNYIIVNSEGIIKLVDIIGGIPIYIEQTMNYDDYSANLHIHFAKGERILNGREAEGYLRFRKDTLGDIGRVHRQQKFINALIEKAKSPDTLKKIPDAIKIMSLYSKTDLNLYQMSQYVAMARDIDRNKIEFVMLPGAPNRKGIVSYWILDPEQTQSVINRLIYRQKDEMLNKKISVGIVYSLSKELEAITLKDDLKSAGYDVNCTGKSAKVVNGRIIGYNTSISNNLIKDMKRKIPSLSRHKFIHQPVRSFCDTSDMVITLNSK